MNAPRMIDRMVARRRSASKALLALGDIACQAVGAGLAGWGLQDSNLRMLRVDFLSIHLRCGPDFRPLGDRAP
jgi:hypothetical protein